MHPINTMFVYLHVSDLSPTKQNNRKLRNLIKFVNAMPDALNTPFSQMHTFLTDARNSPRSDHVFNMWWMDGNFTQLRAFGNDVNMLRLGNVVTCMVTMCLDMFKVIMCGVPMEHFRDVDPAILKSRLPAGGANYFKSRSVEGGGVLEECDLKVDQLQPVLEAMARSRIIRIGEDGSGLVVDDMDAANDILDAYLAINDMLFVALHIGGGQPPRVNDELRLKIRSFSGGALSTIYISPKGELMLGGVYVKNLTRTQNANRRVRAAPECLGSLVLRFLVLRPIYS